MPLVRISVFHEMAAERRLKIAAAVYDAMRSTLGIPEGDRFIVLSAHSQDELIVDPHFMHVQRTSDFVLVHVTLRRGRSIETKQSFYKEAARLLAEVMIHAATAIPVSSKPEATDWEMNDRIRVDGTRALAEATARAGAKMLVVQSITWIARPADESAFDEDSPFHADPSIRSTADMEMIARETGARNGFRTAILRCGWFHAPDAVNTRAFGELFAARKLPILVSKGGKSDAVWSLVHVDDAASAFVAATEAGRSGLWHVTDNEPVLSEEYLRELAKRIGAPEPRRVPAWLAKWIAGESAVNFMTASTRTSNARFRRDFGWSPKFPGYREALDEIVASWRAENFLGLGRKAAA